MKKIRNLPEGSFLKLLFAFWASFFLIAAFCMPDRANMLPGLWQILSQPSKLTCSYFALGGYAATFLNMGLVCCICLGLFVIFKGTPNNASTLAVILTTGFGVWGINILNLWPSVFGVWLYCLIKKEKFGPNVNAMLFSTGIAPLLTDLMIRYPNDQVVGFNLTGILLSLLVGAVIGFFLPAGLAFSPKVHKGFDLYSAALPVGMTAFFLHGILYKAPGVAVPDPVGELHLADPVIVNGFCIALFGSLVLAALLMGGTWRDYWRLLTDPDPVVNFSAAYGNATMLMNVGLYGLYILLYYNLIGAEFNGVTFGVIFCMLSTCNSGSHPGNVWPIMLGYVLASTVCGWLSPLVGGNFTLAINAQAIMVGLCYANGLSPISSKYGWRYSFIAAMAHYCMVTMIPSLHGGFCLYNGGFTAALVCLVLVPPMEKFFRSKADRMAIRAAKK